MNAGKITSEARLKYLVKSVKFNLLMLSREAG